MQHDDELAAAPVRIGAEPARKLGSGQRDHGLELLGQLAAQAQDASGHRRGQLVGEAADPVRRLEQHVGPGRRRKRGDRARARRTLRRQEAVAGEASRPPASRRSD